MAKSSYVKDDSGHITHERVTSDDGRESRVYESTPLGRGQLTEIADHRPDGTTVAYEPIPVLNTRGDRKS